VSPISWWARKARRFKKHVVARVSPAERRAVAAWTRPAELALFDEMHPADRRHGLEVVALLGQSSVTEREILVAGLLHDCGKGDTGAGPRIAWSLGEVAGPWVRVAAAKWPGWGAPMARLRDHAGRSATMLEAAGLGARAVTLVREQEAPTDPEYGARFHAADEAS
jgi:hypothetical protein